MLRLVCVVGAMLALACGSDDRDNSSSSSGTGAAGGGGGPNCNADLSSDPNHCGACGHACLGGDCAEGKCLPIELAKGQWQLRALATDDERVYCLDAQGFNGEQRIFSVPLDGGAITEHGGGAPRGGVAGKQIWVDDEYLYNFAENIPTSQISRSSKTAIAWSLWCGTCGLPSMAGALDQDAFYYAHNSARYMNYNAVSIHRVAKGRANPMLVGLVPPDASEVLSLTVHDTQLFALFNYPPSGPVGVAALPKAGGDGVMIAQSPGQPVDDDLRRDLVAADDARVYWLDMQGVYAAPHTGGAAELMAEATDPASIAIDDAHVYWTEHGAGPGDGRLLRVATAGGTAETLVAGLESPGDLVLTSAAIVWADTTTFSVMKLAK